MITLSPRPFLIPRDASQGLYDLHIDNSAKELFETCARAAEYYTVYRREGGGERASLSRGDIIHKALALRKQAQLDGRTDFEPSQIELILNAYADKDFGPDEWRTAEHAVNTIKLYNKQWPVESEPFTIVPNTIEFPFKILLGSAALTANVETHAGTFWVHEVDIYWTGKMDNLIEYGMTLVEDHKTTSILGSQFWDDFQLSSQMQSYVWSARKLGYDCKGIMIDALAGRKPTRTGKANEFQRQRLFYEQEHLDEWERDTFTLITDFLEHLCRGYFPKSPKWCFGKYGCCQYWEVCTQKPKRRRDILMSDLFKEVTWSPLNES